MPNGYDRCLSACLFVIERVGTLVPRAVLRRAAHAIHSSTFIMHPRRVGFGIVCAVSLLGSAASAQAPRGPRLRAALSVGPTGIVNNRGDLGAPGVQASLGVRVRGARWIGAWLEGSVFAFRGQSNEGGVDAPNPILSVSGGAVVHPAAWRPLYAVIGGGMFRTEAQAGEMITKPGVSVGVGAMITRSERIAVQVAYHHMVGDLPHTDALFPLALVWRF